MSDLYRSLPSVPKLLGHPALAGLPHDLVVGAARQVLSALRDGISDGSITTLPDIPAEVAARAHLLARGRMEPVINATGVVVHTNLGRAPWAPEVVEAAMEAAGYCNVEMDLDSGRRGGRLTGVAALVEHLTGAEDALVVNNCAAAVLLALTALARDREVVVSRGELVEIGGSFRVPEVIASGGARLVEVGATNRTRVADFEAAITDHTAAILRVHPSNFRVVGFTEQPDRSALAALARERDVWMLEDLGSGSLDGAFGEASVREALREGADLVMFSGDKLLGGPQAGVVAGRRDAVAWLRKHPLYRALRVDKVILAALERTLALHARGEAPPALAMIQTPADVLEARAHALSEKLTIRGISHAIERDTGFVGGGALPGQGLPTFVVTLPADDAMARSLRVGRPSVVARLGDGALRFDVRTLTDAQLDPVADRVADVVGRRDRSPR
ncbi:MAG: L-seryl-tRNA(Sec) selenium transferase [Myxococcota bacterium]